MAPVRFHGWDALCVGPFDVPTPIAADAFEDTIDAAVVPGLGFSPRGDRLGYGAGYYDRWLAAHPETRRVAIAYDCQVDGEDFETEPHDVIMDCLITESRELRFRPPGRLRSPNPDPPRIRPAVPLRPPLD